MVCYFGLGFLRRNMTHLLWGMPSLRSDASWEPFLHILIFLDRVFLVFFTSYCSVQWAPKFNLLVRIAYPQILGLIPQSQIHKFVRINPQIANFLGVPVRKSANLLEKIWICGLAEVLCPQSQIRKLSQLRKVCKSKKKLSPQTCGFAERPPLHICKLMHSLRLISIHLNCPKGEKLAGNLSCLYEKNQLR